MSESETRIHASGSDKNKETEEAIMVDCEGCCEPVQLDFEPPSSSRVDKVDNMKLLSKAMKKAYKAQRMLEIVMEQVSEVLLMGAESGKEGCKKKTIKRKDHRHRGRRDCTPSHSRSRSFPYGYKRKQCDASSSSSSCTSNSSSRSSSSSSSSSCSDTEHKVQKRGGKHAVADHRHRGKHGKQSKHADGDDGCRHRGRHQQADRSRSRSRSRGPSRSHSGDRQLFTDAKHGGRHRSRRSRSSSRSRSHSPSRAHKHHRSHRRHHVAGKRHGRLSRSRSRSHSRECLQSFSLGHQPCMMPFLSPAHGAAGARGNGPLPWARNARSLSRPHSRCRSRSRSRGYGGKKHSHDKKRRCHCRRQRRSHSRSRPRSRSRSRSRDGHAQQHLKHRSRHHESRSRSRCNSSDAWPSPYIRGFYGGLRSLWPHWMMYRRGWNFYDHPQSHGFQCWPPSPHDHHRHHHHEHCYRGQYNKRDRHDHNRTREQQHFCSAGYPSRSYSWPMH